MAITDRIASYRWAVREAQDLHLAMSEVVSDEIEALRGLDPRVPALAALAA